MTTSQREKRTFDVFTAQQRALSILMGWAAGSLVAGWLWWQSGMPWWRGMGSQFAGWGLIDGIIAWFGLRGARRNATRLASGDIDQAELQGREHSFERLLWINSALDVGYVLGGGWLVKHYADEELRRGMGWGIIIQGGFLLVFDVALAWLLRVKRHAD
jgi:hypothetical protein